MGLLLLHIFGQILWKKNQKPHNHVLFPVDEWLICTDLKKSVQNSQRSVWDLVSWIPLRESKHGYVNKLDVAPLVLIPVGGIKSCQGQSKFCK